MLRHDIYLSKKIIIRKVIFCIWNLTLKIKTVNIIVIFNKIKL